MSDPGSFRENDPNSGDLADQAVAAGKQAKNAAADFAQTTMDTVKRRAGDAADAAKDIAGQAGERLQEEAMGKKGEAADYVSRLADAMRRAAGEFESDLPAAASYIRSAADQVESVSESVRHGDFKDLLEGAQSFARSQPTAFVGLAALAGFGLVRFLKSSAHETPKADDAAQTRYDYH